MTMEALARLTHAKGASEWAVTAYKDAKLIRLDLVNLSGVYCLNSIELVWDVLATLPFKNTSVVWQAGCQKNKAELRSASLFYGSLLVCVSSL
ncbi:hypothetical protein DSO57_1039503 [Entomophthora muscae]|uniref:Uncharacterized protein n=1 Tax=Entomophthora muscae TaxID=34485 RepID=A0ACC2SYD5_9FUNG|nr:hypothetical protein DSO57_1039503 [Entomophthora muscae]